MWGGRSIFGHTIRMLRGRGNTITTNKDPITQVTGAWSTREETITAESLVSILGVEALLTSNPISQIGLLATTKGRGESSVIRSW